jgi:hypothetical protein
VAEAVGEMISPSAGENMDATVENSEKLHILDISTQNGSIDKKGTPCIASGSDDKKWYRRVELNHRPMGYEIIKIIFCRPFYPCVESYNSL